MDAESNVGKRPSSVLREQIQQTQAALGGKIGALEEEVLSVATHARDAVRERVSAFQGVVDVRQHFIKRPLLTGAIAVGLGVLIALRRGRPVRQASPEAPSYRASRRKPGLWSYVGPEVATLRALVIGRVLAAVGERLKERLKGSEYWDSYGDRPQRPTRFR